MAKHNAIEPAQFVQKLFLHPARRAPSVNQSDLKTAYVHDQLFGQLLPDRRMIHIPAYCPNFFIAEHIQYLQINQVSGVKNKIRIEKIFIDDALQILIKTGNMRVGQYAYFYFLFHGHPA
jgi:hypothetical protein